MSSKIEQLIQLHLRAGRPAAELAQEFRHKIRNGMFSWEERLSIFGFFLNSGFYQEALGAAASMIEKKHKLPFAHLMEILERAQCRPGKAETSAWFKGIRKQEALNLAVVSKAWDSFDDRYPKARREIERTRREEFARQRETLLEKLGFFQSQRMVEEERRLLETLLRLYPRDAAVKTQQENFEDRWARHVLADRSGAEHPRELVDATLAIHQQDELAVAKVVADYVIELVKTKPKSAYNFSIGFLFFELYNDALAILQEYPRDLAGDWLQVELLLLDRRFIDTLECLREIEARQGSDPEVTFAVTYVRARALKGLGQLSQAIELLRGIIAVRPQYRSAQTLLLDWQGGVRE